MLCLNHFFVNNIWKLVRGMEHSVIIEKQSCYAIVNRQFAHYYFINDSLPALQTTYYEQNVNGKFRQLKK